ncbi:MAG: YbaB/EbfC family nucleoid-associated protein [Desulfobacterota bacterium]|nr:YbaB/EbfC family nucleoid-associated protein [Thermodesulfobacteriota bacterium]MDW8001471.1 YbaB/EbfC family nucleoid-associated protein [Deltaproteobacteria bacterium]
MNKALSEILKQAKKIQEQFQKLQEEVAEKKVEAQSGGGMVTCVVNGKQEVVSIKISDEVWQEGDKELIEDLIVAAINEGLNKSREMVKEKIANLAGLGGLNLPFYPF